MTINLEIEHLKKELQLAQEQIKKKLLDKINFESIILRKVGNIGQISEHVGIIPSVTYTENDTELFIAINNMKIIKTELELLIIESKGDQND